MLAEDFVISRRRDVSAEDLNSPSHAVQTSTEHLVRDEAGDSSEPRRLAEFSQSVFSCRGDTCLCTLIAARWLSRRAPGPGWWEAYTAVESRAKSTCVSSPHTVAHGVRSSACTFGVKIRRFAEIRDHGGAQHRCRWVSVSFPPATVPARGCAAPVLVLGTHRSHGRAPSPSSGLGVARNASWQPDGCRGTPRPVPPLVTADGDDGLLLSVPVVGFAMSLAGAATTVGKVNHGQFCHNLYRRYDGCAARTVQACYERPRDGPVSSVSNAEPRFSRAAELPAPGGARAGPERCGRWHDQLGLGEWRWHDSYPLDRYDHWTT